MFVQLKAPTAAWAVLLAGVAATGGVLLVVASVAGGQHAHGHWVQPAKLAGVCLLGLAGLGMRLLLARPNERDR
jgi:hypothetical protein